MAAAQLRAAFPNLSSQQVDDALRKCAGNANRAVEVLLRTAQTPARATAPSANLAPPDIRRQPEAWFRFFDTNGNGLEQGEVVDAVVRTFPNAERGVVREMIASLWPMFDPDRSGTISLPEFVKRDGLRDTLLAQLGGATASTDAGRSAGGGRAAASPAEDQLKSMFPQAGRARISEALERCRGNVSAAADFLMRQQAASPRSSAPLVMGRPVHLAPGAPGVACAGTPTPSGRRRALLIGINYFGTQAQLRGCINDVNNMQRLLMESFGWTPGCMRVLRDDNPQAMPTRANIEASMRWLVEGVRPGDVLFFHFSGHGAQQEDPHGFEEDGMNETILPVDFKRAGMITDDHMGDLLVKHLPSGVRLTAIMDCCHSGTGLDLPYTWTGRGWKEETNPFHSAGDVQMFSGCADDDTSADSSMAYGAAGGAMTTAFCDVLRASPCPSYPELIANLNRLLRMRGFHQRAQLTSSQCFNFDRPFLLDDIIPNGNLALGRIFRRKFPPRPRRMDGPLADMLGIGAAVVGGMILGDVLGDIAAGLFG
mmetsp:Transcript_96865/g.278732  ORF Transcript_96865/g.278732 Transcript_96865/m.278732 type:complete len:539 (+) Transcript_96865:142-1758(+)